MGLFQSSSFILTKIATHEDDLKYIKLMPGLAKKHKKLSAQIYDKTTTKSLKEFYNTFDCFVNRLKKLIKAKNNKANCWENAIIINHALLKKGENPHNFQMNVSNMNGDNFNHFSTVYGLKKGAKINDPSTWGTKAVIVDGWKGIVMKAADAISYLTQELSVGKPLKKVVFADANPKIFVPNIKEFSKSA